MLPRQLIEGKTPRPTPEQPGTLGQQIGALVYSLYLGNHRGTSAAREWQDARKILLRDWLSDEGVQL